MRQLCIRLVGQGAAIGLIMAIIGAVPTEALPPMILAGILGSMFGHLIFLIGKRER